MTRFKNLISLTIGAISISNFNAETLEPPELKTDGKIGTFKQTNSGDCFFLATLIALTNDPDGKSLVESAFEESSGQGEWKVVFPNRQNFPQTVNQEELADYKLVDIKERPQADLVTGDPDVRIFEIAADKVWRAQKIKPLGLWDDVPMNALAMFCDTSQQLVWNRKKSSPVTVQDVDKYKRLPKKLVKDQQVSSQEDAYKIVKSITDSDSDGLTMVLMDYDRYHAVAITGIDFIKMKYSYVDSLKGTENTLTTNLDILLKGLADGRYAINYMEVPAQKKEETD